MSPDRVSFKDVPPTSERLAWCEWLRRHSIDPNQVVGAGGWIERQPELYRVAFLAIVRDEDGFIVFDGDGSDGPRTEARYVQLEGPPLPWPDLTQHAGWRGDER